MTDRFNAAADRRAFDMDAALRAGRQARSDAARAMAGDLMTWIARSIQGANDRNRGANAGISMRDAV